MNKDIYEYIAKMRVLMNQETDLLAETKRIAQEQRDLTISYLREHPLSDAEKERLRDRVKLGRPFCCKDGLQWLNAAVSDPLWVSHLNEWAYEHGSGCKPRASTDPMWLHNLDKALNNVEQFVPEGSQAVSAMLHSD